MKNLKFKKWQKVVAIVLAVVLILIVSPVGRFVYAATASALGVWQTSNTFTITENGTYTVYARDAAGNVSSGYTFTVSNIDNAPPTLSVDYSTTSWTNGDVTLVINSVDQASPGGTAGTVTLSVIGSDSTVYGVDTVFTQNTSGTVTSTDDVGNSVSLPFNITWIDKTSPDLVITADKTEPTNTAVTLTMSATDDQSGLATDMYSWDNVNWSASPSKVFEENGTYIGYARDLVGNISSYQYDLSNIDKSNPIINGFSFSTENPINTEVVVTADVVDVGLGLDASAYNFNNEGWQISPDYTVTANGTYTLVVRDKAGNTAESTFVVSNLDFDAPIIHWATPNTIDPTNEDVVFDVGAEDAQGGHGLATEPYRIKELGVWQASNLLAVAENGTYTIEVTDAAGNITSVVRDVSNIDKVLPVISAVPDTTDPVSRDIVITISASDNVEIANVVDKDGNYLQGIGSISSKTYEVIIETNGTYKYTVIDTAGNESFVEVVVDNIDKVNPVIDSIVKNPDDPINTTVEVTVNASDSGVGLDAKPFSFDGGSWVSSGVVVYNTNGDHTVSVRDKAGNTITQNYSITNLDFDAPVINSITQDITAQTNKDVQLIVDATDVGLGLEDKAYKLNDGAWQSSNKFLISENGTYKVTIVDDAGNEVFQNYTVGNIDKVLPAVSHTVDIEPDVPTKSNVVITLQASDNVEIESITLPNGVVKNIYDVTAGLTYTATASGNYTFAVKDTAGSVNSYVVNIPNIDKSPASISVKQSIDGWTSSNHTMDVYFEDDYCVNKVSINGVWYDLTLNEMPNDALVRLENGVIKGIVVTLDVTGNDSYSFKAVDYSGNETSYSYSVTNIDRTNPSAKIEISPDGNTNQDVTIKVSGIDGYGEVAKIILPDGTVVTGGNAEFVVSSNGVYEFTIVDDAGNQTVVSKEIKGIDKTPPTVEFDFSIQEGDWTSEKVVIEVVAKDTNSDFIFVLIKGDVTQTNDTGKFEITENGEYTIEVTDSVGNKYTETFVIGNIDTEAPTVSVSLKSPYWVDGRNTIIVNGVDDLSGIAEFSLDGVNWQSGGSFNVTYEKSYTVYVKDLAGNISKTKVSFDLVVAPSSGSAGVLTEGIYEPLLAKTDALADGSLNIVPDLTDMPVTVALGTEGFGKVIEVAEEVMEEVGEVAKVVAPYAGVALALTLGILGFILMTDGVRVYGRDKKNKWKYLGISRCHSSLSGYTVKVNGKVLKMVDGCDFKLVFGNKYSTTHKGADLNIKVGNQNVKGNIYKNVEFSITR